MLAAVTVATVFAGSVAQAQSYERYGPAPAPAYDSARYGSADPCRRTAGNRALGWGLFGLVAGGFAGGAVAAAGVVAEGAALGALAGDHHRGQGAGRLRRPAKAPAYWNHPAYQSYQNEGPPAYDDRQYGAGYGRRCANTAPAMATIAGYDDRYQSDYGREYERAPATYYARRVTPNSSYEYRPATRPPTTYGGARYNAYSDRSRCCVEPRREHYDARPLVRRPRPL